MVRSGKAGERKLRTHCFVHDQGADPLVHTRRLGIVGQAFGGSSSGGMFRNCLQGADELSVDLHATKGQFMQKDTG